MQKQLGGKGTVRRVKKAVTKASTMDDKRLQATLKRLAVNNIPGIEEVNIFKDDGNVIHFENPKGASRILVVSGVGCAHRPVAPAPDTPPASPRRSHATPSTTTAPPPSPAPQFKLASPPTRTSCRAPR